VPAFRFWGGQIEIKKIGGHKLKKKKNSGKIYLFIFGKPWGLGGMYPQGST